MTGFVEHVLRNGRSVVRPCTVDHTPRYRWEIMWSCPTQIVHNEDHLSNASDFHMVQDIHDNGEHNMSHASLESACVSQALASGAVHTH